LPEETLFGNPNRPIFAGVGEMPSILEGILTKKSKIAGAFAQSADVRLERKPETG